MTPRGRSGDQLGPGSEQGRDRVALREHSGSSRERSRGPAGSPYTHRSRTHRKNQRFFDVRKSREGAPYTQICAQKRPRDQRREVGVGLARAIPGSRPPEIDISKDYNYTSGRAPRIEPSSHKQISNKRASAHNATKMRMRV